MQVTSEAKIRPKIFIENEIMEAAESSIRQTEAIRQSGARPPEKLKPPEKLISTEALKEQLLMQPKQPPKPFESHYVGSIPSSFTPSESPVTLSYSQLTGPQVMSPQVMSHQVMSPQVMNPHVTSPQVISSKSSPFPRSIQDVIKYMSDSYKQYFNGDRQSQYGPQVDKPVHEVPEETELISNSDVSVSEMRTGMSFQMDPFNSYKPKDPSDVNLMATGNLRFAPPAWVNMRKHKSRDHNNIDHRDHGENRNHNYGENRDRKENKDRRYPYPTMDITNLLSKGRGQKPLVMTLNLYPIQNDEAQSSSSHKLQNRYRLVKTEVDRYGPKSMRPKKMVIKLNLFSNDDKMPFSEMFNGNVELDIQKATN